MNRFLIAAAMAVLCCLGASAQAKPSVSILGDSYSTFQGYLTPDTNEVWYFAGPQNPQRTDVTKVSDTWWWQVIKRMGWKLDINNSYSGATICNTGYNDSDYTHRSFMTRHDNLGSPDIIFIFGATNDSWAGVPVGDFIYEGQKRADLYCFRPALARLLYDMQQRYPTADIYYIVNDGLRPEVTQSIDAVAAHYGIPVIRLHDIDKISGHPSVKGMTQIADQVTDYLGRHK